MCVDALRFNGMLLEHGGMLFFACGGIYTYINGYIYIYIYIMYIYLQGLLVYLKSIEGERMPERRRWLEDASQAMAQKAGNGVAAAADLASDSRRGSAPRELPATSRKCFSDFKSRSAGALWRERERGLGLGG